MSQKVRLDRCTDPVGSDALSLRRSFELPAESKWVGLNSSLNCLARRRAQVPDRPDPCHLPALQPAIPIKHSRLEEQRRRKDRWAKRARPKPSVRPKPRPKHQIGLLGENEGQDLPRPVSSLSGLSLPSPRREEDNHDALSASAVLKAALTGSFLDLDDDSLELQVSSDLPYTWSPYSSSQDENDDSRLAGSQSGDVDECNLSAINLMRPCQNGRVPLSTLQPLVVV